MSEPGWHEDCAVCERELDCERALQAMHDLIVWMFCNVCREFDDVLTLQEWGVGKVEWR